jgi:hypothetical protein
VAVGDPVVEDGSPHVTAVPPDAGSDQLSGIAPPPWVELEEPGDGVGEAATGPDFR